MTNAALGALCLERGLPNYGNKQTLIARLTDHDATQAPAPEENNVSDLAALLDDDTDRDTDELPAPAVNVAIRDGADDLAAAQARQIAELQAAMRDMQAALGQKVAAGERASDSTIDRVRNTEKVFRAEYPLPKAAQLGEELHAAYCQQVADDAVAAGYRVRGGGRRYGWGTNEHGQRVALYEIFARKQ